MFTCKQCGKELPETLEYFSKHPTRKSGLQEICRECVSVNTQIRNAKLAQQQREETRRIVEERAASKVKGVRLVTFSSTWKPNREGLRSNYEDKMGIASSLNI